MVPLHYFCPQILWDIDSILVSDYFRLLYHSLLKDTWICLHWKQEISTFCTILSILCNINFYYIDTFTILIFTILILTMLIFNHSEKNLTVCPFWQSIYVRSIFLVSVVKNLFCFNSEQRYQNRKNNYSKNNHIVRLLSLTRYHETSSFYSLRSKLNTNIKRYLQQ